MVPSSLHSRLAVRQLGMMNAVQSAWEVYQAYCETVLCHKVLRNSMHYSGVLGRHVGLCLNYGQIITVKSDALSFQKVTPSESCCTMAKSSCHCMERLGCGCQLPLNQTRLKNAPNPKAPEASVNNRMDSASFHSGEMNMEIPFQDGKKLPHHRMSALASDLRWMW